MAFAGRSARRHRWPGTDFAEKLKRAIVASSEDNIALLAAGVAYYAFLAIVPLLAATVLIYGLVASPALVAEHLQILTRELPGSAAQLIGEQLVSVVQTSASAKGVGLLLALLVALFGARNGAAGLVTAISLAFNDREKRGMLRATALALVITLGVIAAVGLVVAVLALVPARSGSRVLAIGLLTGLGTLGAGWLYCRVPLSVSPSLRQVLPAATLASLAILAVTLGFAFYVDNFGNYNATYGSLGAVIVLLTWLYLSAFALLLGAEIAAVCVQEKAG